ncbi:MAG TPA: MGMT family protein [Patescibacteria group bacterium]|nr:MGMT family protein [Patescibacteria group bacterium]
MKRPPVELTRALLKTDWGTVASVWSETGLWELSFPREDTAAALADIQVVDVREAAEPQDEWPAVLEKELQLYFRGFPADFSGIPLDWRHYTPFQAAVLRHTQAIPSGTVATYGQVAREVGYPRAARAVGGALHINRTPLVIPCHRVIGSGGALTGFGGGLEMKQALLLLEGWEEK